MLERFKQRKKTAQTETARVFEENTFENFIRDERIPSFWDAGDKVIVVLPPVGVKKGDEYELICGGGIEYFAPNGGPSKGFASLHEVSLNEASRLKAIKNSILEEMDLQTS